MATPISGNIHLYTKLCSSQAEKIVLGEQTPGRYRVRTLQRPWQRDCTRTAELGTKFEFDIRTFGASRTYIKIIRSKKMW